MCVRVTYVEVSLFRNVFLVFLNSSKKRTKTIRSEVSYSNLLNNIFGFFPYPAHNFLGLLAYFLKKPSPSAHFIKSCSIIIFQNFLARWIEFGQNSSHILYFFIKCRSKSESFSIFENDVSMRK